jgi:hypothetical protein
LSHATLEEVFMKVTRCCEWYYKYIMNIENSVDMIFIESDEEKPKQ